VQIDRQTQLHLTEYTRTAIDETAPNDFRPIKPLITCSFWFVDILTSGLPGKKRELLWDFRNQGYEIILRTTKPPAITQVITGSLTFTLFCYVTNLSWIRTYALKTPLIERFASRLNRTTGWRATFIKNRKSKHQIMFSYSTNTPPVFTLYSKVDHPFAP